MNVENLSKDLARVSTETMADIVELRLREFFKKKSFKPGDALPKEMELVEALGVSRNVVREALSRLRMLGLVETKKKRGMILARPDVLRVAVAVNDVDQVVTTPLRGGADHNTEMARIAGCLAPPGVGPVAGGERNRDCCC